MDDKLQELLSLKRKHQELVDNSHKRRRILNELFGLNLHSRTDEDQLQQQQQAQHQLKEKDEKETSKLRVKKVVAQTLLSKQLDLPIDSDALLRMILSTYVDFEMNSTEWSNIEPILDEFDEMDVIDIAHIQLVRSSKCVVLDVKVSKLVQFLYAINKKIGGGGFSLIQQQDLDSDQNHPNKIGSGLAFDG
jgi:hypothetical protein